MTKREERGERMAAKPRIITSENSKHRAKKDSNKVKDNDKQKNKKFNKYLNRNRGKKHQDKSNTIIQIIEEEKGYKKASREQRIITRT